MNDKPHISVLYNEVIDLFAPVEMTRFIDATLGAAGHSLGILEGHPELKEFVGVDQDDVALEIAKEKLAPFKNKLQLIKGNFRDLEKLAPSEKYDGILVDLGVSSMHFDEGARGFSFRFDAPLDMRMDQSQPLTAKEVVNSYSEGDLGRIFRDFGEEKYWRRAAKEIVKRRAEKEIETTFELREVLDPIWPAYVKRKATAPVTKVFQALRIEVNGELEAIRAFLPQALSLLNPKGRLAVISFHSLEDRLVKRFFQEAASDKVSTSGRGGVFLDKEPHVKLVTRGACKPTEEEISQNPRSRSARLRVAEKL